MSALRLLPWPLHQALAYAAGVFCVVAPLLLGYTDSIALAVFIGAGVALLGLGVLGKGKPGVAQVLPSTVHVALTYVLGFFMLLAPFLFRFTDEQVPLTTSILVGLGLVVVTLLAAVPEESPAAEGPATGLAEDQEDESDQSESST